MLGYVLVGSCEQVHEVRIVGHAGPGFLPVENIVVPFLHRLRGKGRQIGPCTRLGKPLTPDLLGTQDLGQVAFLLFLGAAVDDGGSHHGNTDEVDGGHGRSHARNLLVEDLLLDDRGAASPVFLGPVQAGPSPFVQLFLPTKSDLNTFFDVRGAEILIRVVIFRQVFFQPVPYILTKGFFFGCVCQIHRPAPLLRLKTVFQLKNNTISQSSYRSHRFLFLMHSGKTNMVKILQSLHDNLLHSKRFLCQVRKQKRKAFYIYFTCTLHQFYIR